MPSSRRVFGAVTRGAHAAIAAAFGVCRRTSACPEPASGEVLAGAGKRLAPQLRRCSFLGSRTLSCSLLQPGWQSCAEARAGWDTALGKRPRPGGEVGLLKSEQRGIPNSVCMFLVGFLCERFWSLASELVHCRVGNRSRRNWESTARPKHRRGVVRACGIKTKQSYTSEARQESL